MGAQRAAWVAAWRAEAAAVEGKHYAMAILDLVKAFERIPHRVVIAYARKLGYNLRLLRLSLAAYRLARRIGVNGVRTAMSQL